MRRALAALLAAAAALAGCDSLAGRMTPVDVPIWRPGVTTEAEIVSALGPPADRSYLPEGQLLERWRGYVGVRTRQRLAYGFVFDAGGRLVRNANGSELHAPGL